ncbi:MAG TPA: FixH family protein [Flavobacteriales bacterium]|nr:FixH family protein [Flavobacteriales bacterium]
MNWGKGIALALFAFASMMAWFMVKATQHPEPLVTEDYYGEELKYQERMEGTARADAFTEAVRIEVQQGSVVLHFPQEVAGKRISGRVDLQRPNAPVGDRSLPFGSDSTTVRFDELDLLPGRYNAAIHWSVNGVDYFTSEKVYVP